MANRNRKTHLIYPRRCIYVMLALSALSLSVIYAEETAQFPENFRR